MDWLIVALVSGLAYWVGHVLGFAHGVGAGRAEEQVRRRLEELR